MEEAWQAVVNKGLDASRCREVVEAVEGWRSNCSGKDFWPLPKRPGGPSRPFPVLVYFSSPIVQTSPHLFISYQNQYSTRFTGPFCAQCSGLHANLPFCDCSVEAWGMEERFLVAAPTEAETWTSLSTCTKRANFNKAAMACLMCAVLLHSIVFLLLQADDTGECKRCPKRAISRSLADTLMLYHQTEIA